MIRRARSARARESAIQQLRAAGTDARPAVPALIAVISGEDLSAYDWSRVYAPQALLAIGWGQQLDAALPQLLAQIASAPAQAVVRNRV